MQMAEGWIDCRGAPRDLGLDQGVHSAVAIREEARHASQWRWRGESLSGADLTRLTRDLDRHFPHLGERLSGLARGARISRRRLERLLARELGATTAHRAGSGVLVGLGSGPRLARSLDVARDRETPVVLRRCEPDHGHATLSVTLPWLAAAIVGVNQAGLAASFTSIPRHGRRGACEAPALLLLEDCLTRFDTAEKAVEWCVRRPAGGNASLLFADRHGGMAGVFVAGDERRVMRPTGGVLMGLGRSLRRATVEKDCRRAMRLDPAGLHQILSSHDGRSIGDEDTPCRHGEAQRTEALVFVDPSHRSLTLLRGAPCRTTLEDAETASL